MAKLSVWAPLAHEVHLDIAGRILPMDRGENGWRHIDTDLAVHGADYAFILDGSDPLPDPRSPWQPYGVLGKSRIFDHSRFHWTDQDWSSVNLGAFVMYELHVGTFTSAGTFEAAIEKLEYLKDLGITHIELMPVVEFVGERGWGYDGVDLFAPHHAYGGPQGLKQLINTCHEKHIGVILDVVYNHLGPAGNFLNRFGHYFMHEMPNVWGEPINFSGPHSDEVRQFFIDNALMWLRDYHADGLRIDAIQAMIDPTAFHVLEQLSSEVDALEGHLRRNTVIIAESNKNDPRVVKHPLAGGYGIDSQWSDDFHHSLHALLTGDTSGYYEGFGSVEALVNAIRHGFSFAGSYYAAFKRRHGRPTFGLSGHEFVAFMQNHDQIGNRPTGERSSHMMSRGNLKIAAALVFTSPFLPLVFMGEEWGASTPFFYFTDHHDEQLAQAVREGRREDFSQFGWDLDKVPDPQDLDTFHKSKLNWGERGKQPYRNLLNWYQQLATLRKALPDLTDGQMQNVEVPFNENEKWLVMYRGDVTVGCNFSDRPRKLPLRKNRPAEVLLASNPVEIDEQGMSVPAESVVILGPAAKGPTFQSFTESDRYF